jgi:hypothetical protein
MKHLKLIIVLSIILVTNLAFQCEKDDDNLNLSSELQKEVIGIVSSGNWRVTSYQESGVDNTSYFTGYNFTFGPNNVLTATKDKESIVGTWSVTADDSSKDDNLKGDVDFNIGFATPSNFSELTEDWNIIEKSSTKIVLKHTSGGNGGIDYLTFEKN